jgi:hypothetical protein
MSTLTVVPSTKPEGAASAAPSPQSELHKKYIAMARAFENVALERDHWRRQAEQLQDLIEKMKQCMKPYEGE